MYYEALPYEFLGKIARKRKELEDLQVRFSNVILAGLGEDKAGKWRELPDKHIFKFTSKTWIMTLDKAIYEDDWRWIVYIDYLKDYEFSGGTSRVQYIEQYHYDEAVGAVSVGRFTLEKVKSKDKVIVKQKRPETAADGPTWPDWKLKTFDKVFCFDCRHFKKSSLDYLYGFCESPLYSKQITKENGPGILYSYCTVYKRKWWKFWKKKHHTRGMIEK